MKTNIQKHPTEGTIQNAAKVAMQNVIYFDNKLNGAVWVACERHLIWNPKDVKKVFELTEELIAEEIAMYSAVESL
jgi:hypothetical protein